MNSSTFVFRGLLTTLGLLTVSAVTTMKAEYVLDFRKGDDLKVIYDSGLRPWRDGFDECTIGGSPELTEDLFIILPTGETFAYSTYLAHLKVLQDNKLADMGCNGV